MKQLNSEYWLQQASAFRSFLLNLWNKSRWRTRIAVFSLLPVATIYYFILPDPLFNDPVCTVIEDYQGVLLGAHIADDGQWRFPQNAHVPEKFRQAIIHFEDKRFDQHPGVDIRALGRAFWQNVKSGKVISGGSTLTMQVVRLSRRDKARTVWEKAVEILLATRIELAYTKEEILSLYASHAPFGGNVVGLDAAAWRYFRRKANQLSWAETCLLAVLPNSPALIHPGRNRDKLLQKRNRLLKKLYQENIIDKESYQLALDETIPDEPAAFPQDAPHLLMRIKKEHQPKHKVQTTIDASLQRQCNRILSQHYRYLSANEIHNAAALIVEVESGKVLAYAGNIIQENDSLHGSQVDVITASRSTGSILKPLLYAAMLTSGDLLPQNLIFDIPTQIAGYAPENYNQTYDGAVSAQRALARSLNVPAVRMLQKFGVPRFHHLLQQLSLSSVTQPPDHYGLTLILGGCEGKLWDLVGIYASMARALNHYSQYNSRYDEHDYHKPVFLAQDSLRHQPSFLDNEGLFSASALWFTFEAMVDVERPNEENQWQRFSSSRRIAWKTGTSFGFRDAWAIGLTPKYVVGIWVGNADGEGRPDLVGIRAAAPILFDLFDLLPTDNSWFSTPYDDMIQGNICCHSGFLASQNCACQDSLWIPATGQRSPSCPFCQIIHLDQSEEYRVHSDCETPANMTHRSWFVLPPAVEWYYKSTSSTYRPLPPYREDCQKSVTNQTAMMEVIYPHNLSQIYVPVELGGKVGKAVFEVAHRKPNTIIYWHIDQELVGKTHHFHHIEVNPKAGKHTLTLVDENGEYLTRDFEVISSNNNNP